MKPYFFLVTLYVFIDSQAAFSQAYTLTGPTKPIPELYYPGIMVSIEFAEKIFLSKEKRILNCPILFDNSWNYPSGSSFALCDDAKLACLRYGLLLKEIRIAKGRYLEELNKTLVMEKQEVKIRLRGCELGLKRTMNGESLQEAAGYPVGSY